jgi:metallophosphoesterase (TIGR00282 family)
MQILKVIMIGDVMGDAGLEVLEKRLPPFIQEQQPDFIMVNGENSANGFGINAEALNRMLRSGADVVSSGNHVWEKRDFWPLLDSEKRVLRPGNYADAPGRGCVRIFKEIRGKKYAFLAVNLQGREFMNPIDCPFRCFDAIEKKQSEAPSEYTYPTEPLNANEARSEKTVVLVDFHAESFREKEAFGFYLDGRASVVAGTHTHVQTADEKILPKGTAYISDLGMCGISDAVIGMEPKICIDRARNQVLYRLEAAASGNLALIQGILSEIDDETGKALSIRRFSLKASSG